MGWWAVWNSWRFGPTIPVRCRFVTSPMWCFMIFLIPSLDIWYLEPQTTSLKWCLVISNHFLLVNLSKDLVHHPIETIRFQVFAHFFAAPRIGASWTLWKTSQKNRLRAGEWNILTLTEVMFLDPKCPKLQISMSNLIDKPWVHPPWLHGCLVP